MEASLPISAAVKPGAKIASAARGGPNANAPSLSLPARFIATGLVALITGAAWLLAQPGILAAYHYSPAAIAVTHLFVLGWITTTVMGAMYQLVPVALETRLYSERLARWQFVLHVVGVAGMVWMFRSYNMKQVGHFASVFSLGLGLFVYNLARTLWRVPKWSVVATAIASALFWISFAATAGLSLAASKCIYDATAGPSVNTLSVLLHGLKGVAAFVQQFLPMAAMHAHAHLGVVGFFLMLIVGVSYKLIPMFTLSEIQNPRLANGSVWLLNLGLAGAFVTVLRQSAWKPVFALVLLAAFALYGWELRAMLKARKRGGLDWGIRYFVSAVGMLAPVGVIGLVLAWPNLTFTTFTGQLENVYGFLALIGVVTFAIIGMLYKIAPFLVWFGVYSRHIGRARVPALADMYSAQVQATGYWTYLAGLLVASAGILCSNEAAVGIGWVLLAASLVTLALNLGLIARHYFRPRLAPLQPITLKANA